MIKIGNQIVTLRKKKGLSQEELAGIIMVSRQAISKWERDEALPDLENPVSLAQALDTSCDTLLGVKREDERLKRSAMTNDFYKKNYRGIHRTAKWVSFSAVFSFTIFISLGILGLWKYSWLSFFLVPLTAIVTSSYIDY